jgi:NAD(P)-dependent dehydrogenase (short-subunit alcohol dehydrogenase family)
MVDQEGRPYHPPLPHHPDPGRFRSRQLAGRVPGPEPRHRARGGAAYAFSRPHGAGRIVALTSDHTAGNLPYGASKGALDRITIAAARKLATLGVTANVINPGPTDTGWISPDQAEQIRHATPLGRLGTPRDCANLVAFLLFRRRLDQRAAHPQRRRQLRPGLALH